jgi:nitric oxide dioxygenase
MELAIDQRVVIKTTFRTVVQNADEFVDNFYDKFFELDPDARKLFHGNIRLQGEKVMEILTTLVASIDLPTVVVLAVSALGRRHVNYGVQREQFATLGTAFLWALEKQLGAAFTPEVRIAWQALYENIAEMAIHAGYE